MQSGPSRVANSQLLWAGRYAACRALVTTVGTAKGLDAGVSPLVAMVMGVVTAAVVGILQDLLGQKPSILLRKEICVSAAIVGVIALLAHDMAGVARPWATGVALSTAFIIRGAAIQRNWVLPVYKPRPGRIPGDQGEVD